MTSHFTPIYNPQENWLYTNISVSSDITPFYQLLTGGQYRRFILTTPNFRCYWGRFLRKDYAYYAGIYLLKNPIEISPDDMPIRPITSADIERAKSSNPDNVMEYWACFYAKHLLNSNTTVLSKGQWKISPCAYLKDNGELCLGVRSSMKFYHDDLLTVDFNKISEHFDWNGFPFDSEISLKNLPDKHNGRVKWWRKKIQENSCPPLLFWWHPHIQSLLLIDGHARLKAYQLENIQPKCLVLTAYKQENFDVNSPERIKERLKILQGVKKSLADGKREFGVKELNQLALSLYNDYSYHHLTITPKVLANLDDIFEQELKILSQNKVFQQDKILQELLKND